MKCNQLTKWTEGKRKIKLTDNKCSHLHRIIAIQIVKFFDTDFEAFSCNLLLNKEAERDYIQEDIENYSKEIENWKEFVKWGRNCVADCGRVFCDCILKTCQLGFPFRFSCWILNSEFAKICYGWFVCEDTGCGDGDIDVPRPMWQCCYVREFRWDGTLTQWPWALKSWAL